MEAEQAEKKARRAQKLKEEEEEKARRVLARMEKDKRAAARKKKMEEDAKAAAEKARQRTAELKKHEHDRAHEAAKAVHAKQAAERLAKRKKSELALHRNHAEIDWDNVGKGRKIKRVWIDAQCMPQDQPKGSRSAEDTADFKTMLTNVNMLYLGCTVLILLRDRPLSLRPSLIQPYFLLLYCQLPRNLLKLLPLCIRDASIPARAHMIMRPVPAPTRGT